MSDPKDDLVEAAAATLDRGVTLTERLELLDLVAKWAALGSDSDGVVYRRGVVYRACAAELRAVMARHDAGKS